MTAQRGAADRTTRPASRSNAFATVGGPMSQSTLATNLGDGFPPLAA